jgi:hypothetical protein
MSARGPGADISLARSFQASLDAQRIAVGSASPILKSKIVGPAATIVIGADCCQIRDAGNMRSGCRFHSPFFASDAAFQGNFFFHLTVNRSPGFRASRIDYEEESNRTEDNRADGYEQSVLGNPPGG